MDGIAKKLERLSSNRMVGFRLWQIETVFPADLALTGTECHKA